MHYSIKQTPLAAAMLLALNSPLYSPLALALAVHADEVGGEFLVNTTITNSQSNSSIAMDADGDFVIVWHNLGQEGAGSSFDIYAQRYTADGETVGDEFRVNATTANSQSNPSIAMDADGDFVIAWQSDLQGGDDYGIYAQRFAGAGNFAAGTVDLNLVIQDDTDPVTAGNNFEYSLATTNNGSGIALGLQLSDTLPAGLTYVSDDAASSGWDCTLLTATLNCNKGFMNAAETSTINVTVTADTAGILNNTASVNAAQTDVNVSDNTDTETTEVIAATETPAASGGGGGSLSIFTLLLALPLWLRRRWLG